MKYKKVIAALTAGMLIGSVQGKTVELDTPNYHIYVNRALDQWGPDKQRPDTGLISLNTGKTYSFKPGTINSVLPSDMPALLKNQTIYYKLYVVNNGNPETLRERMEDKATNDKIASYVLGAGTIALGMFAMGGASGFQATAGTGLAGSMSDIPKHLPPSAIAVSPMELPKTDFTKFTAVDVRYDRYLSGRSGQVIVVYKTPKTEALTKEAFSAAEPLTLSMGETLEEVVQARADDFAARKAIWAECVAAGECKNE